MTGLGGKRVRLYDAENLMGGHEELRLAEDLATRDSACAFSPDGRILFVGNDDGWVRVYSQLPSRAPSARIPG